jgi:hypothetical protein
MTRHGIPGQGTQSIARCGWKSTWAIALGLALLGATLASPPRVLGQGPTESIRKDCEKELAMYCKDVTPEQGRVLACLYAHGNGLSGQCEFALYEVMNQLEKALSPTVRFMKACDKDARKHCPLVEQGEGRILNCLKEKSAHVSPGCRQAMAGIEAK